jgi:site-specific recombinase XerC
MIATYCQTKAATPIGEYFRTFDERDVSSYTIANCANDLALLLMLGDQMGPTDISSVCGDILLLANELERRDVRLTFQSMAQIARECSLNRQANQFEIIPDIEWRNSRYDEIGQRDKARRQQLRENRRTEGK